MNPTQRIARVLCYFVTFIYVSNSLRDSERDNNAIDAFKQEKTGQEAIAVGTSSLIRQKGQHSNEGEVQVDEESEDGEQEVTEEEKTEQMEDRVIREDMQREDALLETETKPRVNVSVKTGRFWQCKNIDVKGVGCHGYSATKHKDEDWQIRRAGSWKTPELMGRGVLMMLDISALGSIAMGLIFSSWFLVAPSESVGSAGLVAFYGWFNAALFANTASLVTGSIFAGAVGASTGIYLSSAAARVLPHHDFAGWKQNYEKLKDLDWLSKAKESCSVIQFKGAFEGSDGEGLYLSELEERTNEEANKAIKEYCTAMRAGTTYTGERSQYGLFRQPGVMPKPSVCIENDKPTRKRQAQGPDKWFTCYDTLRLSVEEDAFQTSLMTMTVMQKMKDSHKRKTPCAEQISVAAPINVIPQACAEKGEGRNIENLFKAARENEPGVASLLEQKVDMFLEQKVDLSGKNLNSSSFTDLFEVKESAQDEDAAAWDWPWSNTSHEGLQIEEGEGENMAKAQGLEFDPDKEYSPPAPVTLTPAEKAVLIQAQRAKEKSLHNCLSMISCQMLRKDITKITGRSKTWFTDLTGLKASHSMLEDIVNRCLGHSDLVGPQYNANCLSCPRGYFGQNKWRNYRGRPNECGYNDIGLR